MLPAGQLCTCNNFFSTKQFAAIALAAMLSACGSQIPPTASPTSDAITTSSASATSIPSSTSTVTLVPSPTNTFPATLAADQPASDAFGFIPVTGDTPVPSGNEISNNPDPASNQPPSEGSGDDKFQNFQPTNSFLIPVTGYPPNMVTRQKPATEIPYDSTDLMLEIPSLEISISIMGISRGDRTWDVSWLWDQAGWLEGTAYPTRNGNSVITAHVVTGDGKNGPFAHLKALGIGEYIFINSSGYRYIYQVNSKESVKPDDTRVFSHEVESRLTLITCDAYDEATQTYLLRTVVRAKLVDIQIMH